MKTLCTAYLAVLLLTLHLSSQVVRAQTTAADMSTAATGTMKDNATASMAPQSTMSPKGGCGISDAFTLLLPVAVAASLLHGCSS